MPKGLTNAPASFQRFMNNIFADIIDISVVVYLDNILVYSNDPEQHLAHVQEVLTQLQCNWLYAQADKCECHCNLCEYLGHMLSPDSLSMAQNKIQAIQVWPEPQKVWDIMSFLRFANFYHHFIYGYSEITVPLTQKDVPWDFSNDCWKSFEKLKEAFTMAPVLTN